MVNNRKIELIALVFINSLENAIHKNVSKIITQSSLSVTKLII